MRMQDKWDQIVVINGRPLIADVVHVSIRNGTMYGTVKGARKRVCNSNPRYNAWQVVA